MEGGHPGGVGSAIDSFHSSSTYDDKVVDWFVDTLDEMAAADSEHQMWQESSGTGAETDCMSSYLDLGFEPDSSADSSGSSSELSEQLLSDTDSVSGESADGATLWRSRDFEDTALYPDSFDASATRCRALGVVATGCASPVEVQFALVVKAEGTEQEWGCHHESLHALAEEGAGGSVEYLGQTAASVLAQMTGMSGQASAAGARAAATEAVGTTDAGADPTCPHCPAEGRKIRSKNTSREQDRKSNKLQAWYSSYGYEGPPYCKRCSEAFNNHLLRRSAKGKNRAGCTRASHCSQCQKILAHVQDVDNMWKLAGKKHVWKLAEKESRLQEKWARSSQR